MGLVEIDVATGTEVKRSKATVEGSARLVREGDALHVAGASTSSFVWLTMDLALEEKRRVTPKKSPATDRDFEAFAVLGTHAVVVSSARGVVAEILDGQGKTLARHDCKANIRAHGLITVAKVGGLAVVDGLVADTSALACGFRSDATGTPIRKKLGLSASLFTHDGVAYVNGAEIHRLDGASARENEAHVPDGLTRSSELDVERCDGLTMTWWTEANLLERVWTRHGPVRSRRREMRSP